MRLANSSAILILACAAAGPAAATSVNVVGLFGQRAVVSIDGGQPRTLSVGQRTPEGVVLLAVGSDGATLEIDGRRRTLAMGQAYSGRASGGNARTVLKADGQGHFIAEGQVNGAAVRFLVDTGATLIALPAADAKRMGVSYLNAPRGMVGTANGSATAYKVKLDSVRVGEITINNVDAVVLEGGLAIPLLGMSFLNRTEMKREGETMVLVKRF
ncbi:MAG: TIGR02281 family clan AA aspartic protease [Burkholderiales bacterium]